MRLCVIALLACLLLAGCGSQPAPAEARNGGEPAEDTENAPEDLFEMMPRGFIFCSGAGAWSTDLTIGDGGAFTGLYLDSDMGSAGEGYDATRYVCGFSGKFTRPVKINSTTWSMEIASMELERPDDGTEELVDEGGYIVRYVYSGPYGLEEAEELLVYLPESPLEDLPEEFLSWVHGPFHWEPAEEGTLGAWGIYNVKEGFGFVEYPIPTGPAEPENDFEGKDR